MKYEEGISLSNTRHRICNRVSKKWRIRKKKSCLSTASSFLLEVESNFDRWKFKTRFFGSFSAMEKWTEALNVKFTDYKSSTSANAMKQAQEQQAQQKKKKK